jgi:hypothetical protein
MSHSPVEELVHLAFGDERNPWRGARGTEILAYPMAWAGFSGAGVAVIAAAFPTGALLVTVVVVFGIERKTESEIIVVFEEGLRWRQIVSMRHGSLLY